MIQLSDHNTMLLICSLIGVMVLHTIFTLYLLLSLRIANRDRQGINKETFGLLRKIDVLTSQQRENMLQHYDKILEEMTARLPANIAAQAGDVIFQTESQLLTKLAELEPHLAQDAHQQEGMDKLIKTMENLEAQIVTITADTVQTVMSESRRDLFRDDFPFVPDSMKQLKQ